MRKALENPLDSKVIVTGGAGFIGSHLTDVLLGQGYRVLVIDDLSTGSLKNIEHLKKNRRLEFVQGSVTDLNMLREAFKEIEYVFHQAAVPSVPRSIENPSLTHVVNVTGTLNVLIAARDCRVKKVVYASSSSVYGDTPSLPKRESMPPSPLSPYAVSKLAAEYYCQVFTAVYGLPTASLRYFNVYGSRQATDSAYAAVIPKFIRAIQNGRPPVIFGDGEQTRDFTFVKDVVTANILAAQSSSNGVFNIGSGKRITVNELTDRLLKLMGRKDIRPVHEPERAGDVKHSLADISLAAASLGYSPASSLEEGLKAAERWLRDK